MTLLTPAAFDPTRFQGEPPAPAGYTGTKFGFELVAELIRPCSCCECTVYILGEPILVDNRQTEDFDQPFPVCFEVPGQHYHYIVAVWNNRVTIEVTKIGTYELHSVMFPVTADQLRRAFQSIVDDAF